LFVSIVDLKEFQQLLLKTGLVLANTFYLLRIEMHRRRLFGNWYLLLDTLGTKVREDV